MRHPHRAAEFQQAQGAVDVGLVVAERVSHGRANPGEGRQVHHGVEDSVWEMVLANVALAEFHTIWQRKLGLQEIQGGDPVAGGVELADDVGADEAGRTGDENGEWFGIHARCGASTPGP